MKKVEWTPLKVFMSIGGVIGVCTAIATAWVQMGGAVPASQLYVTQSDDKIKTEMTRGFRKVESEGKKQTEESAKWGRKIYNQELHDLLTITPPKDPEQHQYWKENVERAQRQRKFYSDKEIELRKK